MTIDTPSPTPVTSARCFFTVVDELGQRVDCEMPAQWHGSVRSARGTHRVFACTAHSTVIDDRLPVVRRLPGTQDDTRQNRLAHHR